MTNKITAVWFTSRRGAPVLTLPELLPLTPNIVLTGTFQPFDRDIGMPANPPRSGLLFADHLTGRCLARRLLSQES
jgi:hypothetical protein